MLKYKILKWIFFANWILDGVIGCLMKLNHKPYVVLWIGCFVFLAAYLWMEFGPVKAVNP